MDFTQILRQGLEALDNTYENDNLSETVQTFLSRQDNHSRIFNPHIDMIDNETTTTLYLDIAGVNPNSIDVDFFNNKIHISGTKEKPYTDIPLKKEIAYGNFKKIITIPLSVINKNSVKVIYKYGVLKITIDKTNEEVNRFSIDVENID